MESGPRNSQSEKALDYIEVEVLPPEGKAKQSDDPDPFIKFVSRLLDTFFVIPGTRIRFGFEPIIGLIPILGDQATVADVGGSLISKRPASAPENRTDPHGAEHFDQWGCGNGAVLW